MIILTSPNIHTPDEWCRIRGIRVADPDGWRVDGKPWDEPIGWIEFVERVSRSTCYNLDRIADLDATVEPDVESYWKEVQEMTADRERVPAEHRDHWTDWETQPDHMLNRERPHGCFPGPLPDFAAEDMPGEDELLEAILNAAKQPLDPPAEDDNPFGNFGFLGELMEVAEAKPKLLRWIDEQTTPGLVQYINPAHVVLVNLVTDEEGERRLVLSFSNSRGALTTDEQTIDSFFEQWEVV